MTGSWNVDSSTGITSGKKLKNNIPIDMNYVRSEVYIAISWFSPLSLSDMKSPGLAFPSVHSVRIIFESWQLSFHTLSVAFQPVDY